MQIEGQSFDEMGVWEYEAMLKDKKMRSRVMESGFVRFEDELEGVKIE